jgi:hypothetical protein
MGSTSQAVTDTDVQEEGAEVEDVEPMAVELLLRPAPQISSTSSVSLIHHSTSIGRRCQARTPTNPVQPASNPDP